MLVRYLATGVAALLGGFATTTFSSIISLTVVPEPEPSAVALVAAAGALGAVRRCRQA